MGKEIFLASAMRCCENSRRLLDETEFLGFEKPQATRYYLSVVAQEEAAKAFLLYLIAIEALPWTPLLLRATRDHRCKQLVGIVLDYISPDTDEFLRRIDKQRLEKRRAPFPDGVADAMNLLRHEKIRRWESKSWCWVENPEYDTGALAVADGHRDRDKQCALYVELGRSGQVSATPEGVTERQANDEYERGRRFEECVCGLVGAGPGFAWDLERVKERFKALFSEAVS
ncbi:MAG: hypothetical protein HY600_01110 [Candidatus Omnitrophica bacterium]|nr:hypothetical protein [Candidatus Omnitrophota bacterium]